LQVKAKKEEANIVNLVKDKVIEMDYSNCQNFTIDTIVLCDIFGLLS
jgi:hypothetical protein